MHALASTPFDRAPDPSTRQVTSPAGLGDLFDPRVNVAVLERTADPAVATALAALLGPHTPSLGLVLEAGRGPSWSPAPLGEVRRVAPAGVGVEALERELWTLAELLSDLTGASAVGVRLARLDRAMCPRFHVDRVTLRCVVTHAGPGTEWLEHHEVDRALLGHRAQGRPDETSGVILGGAAPRRAPTGAAVFLKGELWPGNEARGAVHRSPHVAEGEIRRVVTLDALD